MIFPFIGLSLFGIRFENCIATIVKTPAISAPTVTMVKTPAISAPTVTMVKTPAISAPTVTMVKTPATCISAPTRNVHLPEWMVYACTHTHTHTHRKHQIHVYLLPREMYICLNGWFMHAHTHTHTHTVYNTDTLCIHREACLPPNSALHGGCSLLVGAEAVAEGQGARPAMLRTYSCLQQMAGQ